MNDTAAAAYLGVTVAYLRNQRWSDRKRMERGEAPEGPPWIVLNGRPYREKRALDRWIDARKVEMGEPRNHGPRGKRAPASVAA
jgi:hypothetical protein